MQKHVWSCDPFLSKCVEVYTNVASSSSLDQYVNGTSPAFLFQLHIEAMDMPDMWLDIEMRGKATFNDLDEYLKAIWLDCGCGHLSYFEKMYKRSEIYDLYAQYGPFTNTQIKISKWDRIVDVFQDTNTKGSPLTPNPILLLAPNKPLPIECTLCDKQAAHICNNCLSHDADGEGFYCEDHVHNHNCDEEYAFGYMHLPVVNSPRSGMCGYCGPAEPPY